MCSLATSEYVSSQRPFSPGCRPLCCAIYQEKFPRRCESGQELVASTAWVTGMDPINMGWYWFESGRGKPSLHGKRRNISLSFFVVYVLEC